MDIFFFCPETKPDGPVADIGSMIFVLPKMLRLHHVFRYECLRAR